MIYKMNLRSAHWIGMSATVVDGWVTAWDDEYNLPKIIEDVTNYTHLSSMPGLSGKLLTMAEYKRILSRARYYLSDFPQNRYIEADQEKMRNRMVLIVRDMQGLTKEIRERDMARIRGKPFKVVKETETADNNDKKGKVEHTKNSAGVHTITLTAADGDSSIWQTISGEEADKIYAEITKERPVSLSGKTAIVPIYHALVSVSFPPNREQRRRGETSLHVIKMSSLDMYRYLRSRGYEVRPHLVSGLTTPGLRC